MSYKDTIRTLIISDEKQLLELFYDVADEKDGLASIERLADCAYHFIENYIEKEEEPQEQPEYEEWKDIDDARRAREYESDKGSRTNL